MLFNFGEAEGLPRHDPTKVLEGEVVGVRVQAVVLSVREAARQPRLLKDGVQLLPRQGGSRVPPTAQEECEGHDPALQLEEQVPAACGAYGSGHVVQAYQGFGVAAVRQLTVEVRVTQATQDAIVLCGAHQGWRAHGVEGEDGALTGQKHVTAATINGDRL